MNIHQYLAAVYFQHVVGIIRKKCLFVPHEGFCFNDKVSIINYKADNCLIFVRYLLDNNLYEDKEIVVLSTTPERAQIEQQFCQRHYPKASIRIIPNRKYSSRQFKTEWASSEYIFSSEELFYFPKKLNQKYICLTYYPISLKNDYFDPRHPVYGARLKLASQVDIVSSSSLINSQMDSAAFAIPFYKFKNVGKCRSDVLLQKEDVTPILNYLQDQCRDYKFSKIILYTPTHRDYERALFDMKRSILGFEVNKERFEKFVRENEILIVCKLHPIQNKDVVSAELPTGILNFTGNDEFGLIELMKVSDVLMTDYTSTYVDYLLLDKPVIFNLYDLDMYEKSRGLSFYPYDRICAGEKFTNEESFYTAVSETIHHPNKFANMRKELVAYLNSFHTDVCANTYNEIF